MLERLIRQQEHVTLSLLDAPASWSELERAGTSLEQMRLETF